MLAGDGDEMGEQVESLFHLAVVDSPDEIFISVGKLLESHWGGLYNGDEGSSHEVKCHQDLQMPCQKAGRFAADQPSICVPPPLCVPTGREGLTDGQTLTEGRAYRFPHVRFSRLHFPLFPFGLLLSRVEEGRLLLNE